MSTAIKAVPKYAERGWNMESACINSNNKTLMISQTLDNSFFYTGHLAQESTREVLYLFSFVPPGLKQLEKNHKQNNAEFWSAGKAFSFGNGKNPPSAYFIIQLCLNPACRAC